MHCGGIHDQVNFRCNIFRALPVENMREACEYTNSFLEFFPRYSVILNIEEDHLDFFKDLDDIRDAFRRFASQTRTARNCSSSGPKAARG